MGFWRAVSGTVGFLAWLVPATVFGQTGTIGGSVKDTTGAVLPGVTVEAASPALIEKVRTAITDGQGEYKIVDLRPGVYSVTFSLAGFSSLKREGVELSAGVTANVSAELTVGLLEETVTVSGQSPLVDVQNTTQHRTITSGLLDQLPTPKTWTSVAVLIPGVSITGGLSVQDVGGSTSVNASTIPLAIHGSNSNEAPMVYDGMRYANIWSAGAGTDGTWQINPAMVEEVSIDTSGGGAQAEVSGVLSNIIPKQGGNSFSGYFLVNYSNDSLQASNIDDALRARGATTPTINKKIYDINPAFGGPLKRDKVWFYASFRRNGVTQQPPGARYALNPLAPLFTPDLTRTPTNPAWGYSIDGRVTAQTSRTSKLALFANNVPRCGPCASGLSSTTAWEASTQLQVRTPNALIQGSWNWTISNRLLLEVGQTYRPEEWSYERQPGIPANLSGIVDSGLGLTYRAPTSAVGQPSKQYNGKLNLSYVTGSHNAKFGGQWFWGHRVRTFSANNDSFYNFTNGVPTGVTLRATPIASSGNLNMNLGLYAQDQWTLRRLTANAGVRFDYVNAEIPAQHLTATQFVGPRDFVAINNVPDWRDITPRFGIAYDLFGNGKTALKWNLGKFLEGTGTQIAEAANPANNPAAATTFRSWRDDNGNFVPDCDLSNPSLNLECGANNNNNFGKVVVPIRYAPDTVTGWGTRGYNWETMFAVVHQLAQGLSLDASYNRRSFGNLRVTENTALTPADFDPFCVTTPVDPRLPGGGGQQLCGLYNIKPAKFGQTDNVISLASKYGNIDQVYDGVDVVLNARLPRGVIFQGGTSTGRTRINTCDVVTGRPQITAVFPFFNIVGGTPTVDPATVPRLEPFCNIEPKFLTQFKLLTVYPLPWWGVRLSATYQSIPEPTTSVGGLEGVTAVWAAPLSAISGLGRPLAGGVTTASVQIVPPATLYADRLQQIDFRVTRQFQFGRFQLLPEFDLYNLFNNNAILAVNTAYSLAGWQRPTQILPGRLAKFGVQLTF